jgi:hypothetical protein
MMRFLDICIRLVFPVGQSDIICVPVISPRARGSPRSLVNNLTSELASAGTLPLIFPQIASPTTPFFHAWLATLETTASARLSFRNVSMCSVADYFIFCEPLSLMYSYSSLQLRARFPNARSTPPVSMHPTSRREVSLGANSNTSADVVPRDC